jgi:hypothetical protein
VAFLLSVLRYKLLGEEGLKNIPVAFREGLLCELLTGAGKVVTPTYRPRFIPQKHYFSASGTHFC